MIIDPQKSVHENFLDLLIESNPGFPRLSQDLLILGNAVDDDSVPDRNTSIVVTAKQGSGFSGTRTLYYNRCNLNDLFTVGWIAELSDLNEEIHTPGNLGGMIIEALDQLKSELIVNEGLPILLPTPGQSTIVPVRVRDHSTIFIPGTPQSVRIRNQFNKLIIDYRFEDWVANTEVRNYVDDLPATRIGSAALPVVGVVGNAWNLRGLTAINSHTKVPSGAMSLFIRLKMNSYPTTAAALMNDYINDPVPSTAGLAFNLLATKQLRVNGRIQGDNHILPATSDVINYPLNTWITFGASIAEDNRTVNFYYQGALISTFVLPGPRSDRLGLGNMFFGQRGTLNEYQLDAIFDRVLVFNREITPAEMMLLHSESAVKNSSWSAQDRGSNVTRSEGGRIATTHSQQSIRGATWRNGGKHMFEVTPTNLAGTARFGVALPEADMLVRPASDGLSWVLNSSNGNKANANTGEVYSTTPLAVNNVLGVLVDQDAGTIEFVINGDRKGIAFTDSRMIGWVAPIMGSVSVNTNTSSAILNTGEHGFAFPIDGFEPWCYEFEINNVIAATANDPIMAGPIDNVTAIKALVATRLGIPVDSFKLGANADDVFTLVEDAAGPLKITTVSENVWFNGVANGVANITIGRNTSQYRVILGSWSEIPVKSSTRVTRTGYGPVGQTTAIDFGSSHIPAAGTMVGEKIFDSGGNLLSLTRNDYVIYLSFGDLINNHDNKTFRLTNVTRNITMEFVVARVNQASVTSNPNAAFYTIYLSNPNIFPLNVGDVIDITIL